MGWDEGISTDLIIDWSESGRKEDGSSISGSESETSSMRACDMVDRWALMPLVLHASA